VSRIRAKYQDPDGFRHGGMPTYAWRCAPEGLATMRQLRGMDLRPGGSPVVAQMLWYRGRGRPEGVAYLYKIAACKPKRKATPGRMRSVDAMIRVRSTCRRCLHIFEYCLSVKYGRLCLDCLELEGITV
jgi:hypothetical protein